MLSGLLTAFQHSLGTLFGWIILWPLSYLIPRDRKRYVVIGRDGGKFLDNSKHFFIGLQSSEYKNLHVIFLTDHPDVRKNIEALSYLTARISGPSGWWKLLRCGTAVVDNIDWGHSGRFLALRGGRVVQLWHGVPLKRIELLVAEQIASKLSPLGRSAFFAYRAFIGRHRKVDYLVSTSTVVTQKAMQHCFSSHSWPNTGYPRNDILLNESLCNHPLMSIKVDKHAEQVVCEARSVGRKIVLYTPTFRKHFSDPFTCGVLNLESLDNFSRLHGLLILVKLHPLMQQPVNVEKSAGNIVFARPDSDIYPLMPKVDVLVTDYSSIFFDYLLLDRPILFFCHDLEEYMKDDRGFIFDYGGMTPGPKTNTQSELESELLIISRGIDKWHEQRRIVRELVFDHVDGSAVKRLMSVLEADDIK